METYRECGFEFVKIFGEQTVWYNNNPLPLRLAVPYSVSHPNSSVRYFLQRKIISLAPSDWIDYPGFEKFNPQETV